MTRFYFLFSSTDRGWIPPENWSGRNQAETKLFGPALP